MATSHDTIVRTPKESAVGSHCPAHLGFAKAHSLCTEGTMTHIYLHRPYLSWFRNNKFFLTVFRCHVMPAINVLLFYSKYPTHSSSKGVCGYIGKQPFKESYSSSSLFSYLALLPVKRWAFRKEMKQEMGHTQMCFNAPILSIHCTFSRSNESENNTPRAIQALAPCALSCFIPLHERLQQHEVMQNIENKAHHDY